MYTAWDRSSAAGAASPARGLTIDRAALNRTVVALGATSLVTDISSEMVTSVLPVYVVLHLQYSPLAFGAIEGLYQGGASVARLLGGFLADRSRRHRDVAAVGYLASAVSRLLLWLVGRNLGAIGSAIAVDRIGKGLRTAPRDALISLSVTREHLASAFGVHRAMDTTGAMLGPLVTFAILAWMPGGFDVVFVVSFVLGLLGIVVLLTCVGPSEHAPPAHARPAGNAALTLLRGPRQRGLVLCAGALGLVTIGDGLLYLALQRRVQFGEPYLPLLFVATPAVFMLLALPAAQLADRVGRGRAVIGGYACLLAAYVTVLYGPPSLWTLGVCVTLLGGYYAATDGVLMALASETLPATVRATGLGLVTTANGVGRLMASAGFGWVWARGSLDVAMTVYAVGLLVVLVGVAPALRTQEDAHG